RNTPDDPVAVEVAHGHVSDGDAITFIQPDAAIVKRAFVEHLVVRLVAVRGEAIDGDVGDARALKQREVGGYLRIALEVEAFLQTAIKLEAVAPRGDQRPLDDVGSFAVGIFAD